MLDNWPPGTIGLWPAHLDPPPGWRWWQPQEYYPVLDEYSERVYHHTIKEPYPLER